MNKNIKKDIVIEGYNDLLNPRLKERIAYSNPLVNILYVIEKIVNGKSIVGLTHEVTAIKAMEKNSRLEIVYTKEGMLAESDGVYVLNKNS